MKNDGNTVYDIFHDLPNIDRGLIMMPVGAYYNRELQKVRHGDSIRFLNGDIRKVVSVAFLGLKLAAARLICEYIYNISIERVMRRWGDNAVLEGNGRMAVSDNKCLLIRYEQHE